MKSNTALNLDLPLKGKTVIIRSNPSNSRNIDILGTIHIEPKVWTRITVRYFDPNTGDADEKGNLSGSFVTREFMATHLENPTPSECLEMAKHYKRLALEFNELCKKLRS